jgi:hypothetical protein
MRVVVLLLKKTEFFSEGVGRVLQSGENREDGYPTDPGWANGGC